MAVDPGRWEKVWEQERASWSRGFPVPAKAKTRWGWARAGGPLCSPAAARWEQEAGAKGLLCFNLDAWAELFTEGKREKTLLVRKINGVWGLVAWEECGESGAGAGAGGREGRAASRQRGIS